MAKKALVFCTSRPEKIKLAIKSELNNYQPADILFIGPEHSPLNKPENLFLSWGKESFSSKAAKKVSSMLNETTIETVLIPMNNFDGKDYYKVRLFGRKLCANVVETFPDGRRVIQNDSYFLFLLSPLEELFYRFFLCFLNMFSGLLKKRYSKNLKKKTAPQKITQPPFTEIKKIENSVKPEISVIIRTCNEEAYLRKNLEITLKQQSVSFEVIIIDSGSTDKTIQEALAFPVRVYSIKKEDFSYGGVLNLGAELAKGKIIVCVSAHAIPVDKNWLKELTEPLRDETIAGVHGAEIPMKGNCGSLEMKCLLEGHGVERIVRTNDHTFSNANSAIPVKFIKKFPFDASLDWAEDQFWSYVVQKAGYKTLYIPQAKIYHSHNLDLEGNFTRCHKFFDMLVNRIYKEKSNTLCHCWKIDLVRRSIDFRRFLTKEENMDLPQAFFYAPYCEFILYLGCKTACDEFSASNPSINDS